MYDKKSKRVKVQTAVVITVLTLGVLTLGLVGSAGKTMAATTTSWGTVDVRVEIIETGGLRHLRQFRADLFENEGIYIIAEASTPLPNADLLLNTVGGLWMLHCYKHFLGLAHRGTWVENGDTFTWCGRTMSARTVDADRDGRLAIVLRFDKVHPLKAGREPYACFVDRLQARLRIDEIIRAEDRSVRLYAYDVASSFRGVILFEHNWVGRSIARRWDTNLLDDGIPRPWWLNSWPTSLIIVGSGHLTLYHRVGMWGERLVIYNGGFANRQTLRRSLAGTAWDDRARSVCFRASP
jgi:hypothetical protein